MLNLEPMLTHRPILLHVTVGINIWSSQLPALTTLMDYALTDLVKASISTYMDM